MPETTTGLYAYWVILVALLATGMGFPIPEEIPIVTAGGLSAHAASQTPPEHPVWYLLLPLCILGVVLGDSILYGIGRYGGTRLMEWNWVQKRLVTPEKRARIERNFQKYGIRILLGARLLPGIRAPIFVMAGVMRLPVHRFILADGIYAVPGVSLLFGLAYWFTDSVVMCVDNIEKKVGSVRHFIVMAVIAGIAIFLLIEFLKRRGITGDPAEVPIFGDTLIPTPAPSQDHEASRMLAPLARQQARSKHPDEPGSAEKRGG